MKSTLTLAAGLALLVSVLAPETALARGGRPSCDPLMSINCAASPGAYHFKRPGSASASRTRGTSVWKMGAEDYQMTGFLCDGLGFVPYAGGVISRQCFEERDRVKSAQDQARFKRWLQAQFDQFQEVILQAVAKKLDDDHRATVQDTVAIVLRILHDKGLLDKDGNVIEKPPQHPPVSSIPDAQKRPEPPIAKKDDSKEPPLVPPKSVPAERPAQTAPPHDAPREPARVRPRLWSPNGSTPQYEARS